MNVYTRTNEPRSELGEWEATFAEGLLTSSREITPQPWLAGYVHDVRAAPCPEWVRTDPGSFHHIMLFAGSPHRAEQREGRGGALDFDKDFEEGELAVVSRATNERSQLTRWFEPIRFLSVHLTPEQVEAACRALGRDYARLEFLDRFGTRDSLLEHLLRALADELRGEASQGRLYGEQLLQTVAVHLVATYTAEQPRQQLYRGGLSPERVAHVEAYARAHLAEDIRLADLAAETFLSEYHFLRQFKAATGETPAAFVQRLRMEEARRLLRACPRWTIAAVARAVGYESASHFAKLFHRQWGASPAVYRRELRG